MPKNCIMKTKNENTVSCAVIAAVGRRGELGSRGDLVWRLRGDLRRFKSLTLGHPVIMGRRTWESLPKGALPGRRNIVVTRQDSYDAPGAETAGSLAGALALCAGGPEAFVIGGGQIYAEAMGMASRLCLTMVDAESDEADTWFPAIDKDVWEEVSRQPGAAEGETPAYDFVEYSRRAKEGGTE